MQKTKTLLPLLLSTALICMVQCVRQNNTNTTQNTAPENEGAATAMTVSRPGKLSVKSPFQHIDVAPVRKTVDPARPATLTMNTGTTVEIPAGAFVDQQGKPVTTLVEVSFREFHNAADIIASGIPMTVHSPDGGHDGWMQTAGMFEVLGSANGQEVNIAPDKKIMVNLASEAGGAYDFWFFDPEKGAWVNNGSSNPQPAATGASGAGSQTELKRLRALTAVAPVAPAAYDKNKVSLNFDINVHRFPELQKLRNIVWQYAGDKRKEDPSNNSWIFETDWDDARLEHGSNPNVYQLTLQNDSKEYSIPVSACLKGTDLQKAKAEYEAMYASYQQNLSVLKQKESILMGQAAFMRSMSISSMGIHNYDVLWKQPDTVFVPADFEFGDMPEAAKELIVVYLITGEGRTVIGLSHYDWQNFRFCSNSDNKLLAVLPDNKIAVFTQKDFNEQLGALKKAAAEHTPYVFKMRVKDQPMESVADVQRQLVAAGS